MVVSRLTPSDPKRDNNRYSNLLRFLLSERSVRQEGRRPGQEDHIKKIGVLLLLLFFISACGDGTASIEEQFEEKAGCSDSAIADQFIVHWKSGKVTIEKSKDRKTFMATILAENADAILRAEHDHKIYINNPIKKQDIEAHGTQPVNWGYDKIEAEAAHATAQGEGVVVAVIDSGVEITHSQLDDQLLINEAEKNGEPGVDDDGNGFIDDVNGWDFVFNTGLVTEALEKNSHGTHVAGIIAAEHAGSNFVKGVAPKSKILPLNFMDSEGAGSLGLAILAIDYAIARGSKIINASWGSPFCSSILESKIASLGGQGVLFVNASGNFGVNIEISPDFPAAYDFAHQITVGASRISEFPASFSNFSVNLVDLLAPGDDITSTVAFDDPKPEKSGTSMATPFVSGAAAVLWSAKQSATPFEIKDAIMNSVDKFEVITNVRSKGRLNVRKALDNLLN